MKNGKAVIITYTERGLLLCEAVEDALKDKGFDTEVVDGRRRKISDDMGNIFRESEAIVFVSASGIAVRMIAPYIRSKAEDPAVLVMDDGGKHAISLLSGHLGGANELALAVSSATGAAPVITTATDVNGKFAVDVWTKKAGCAIGDVHNIKYVSSAVLKGEKVGLSSDFEIEGDIPEGIEAACGGETGICVSLSEEKKPFKCTLNVIPKIVAIGAGCRRGTDPEAFEKFILETLREHGISIKAAESLSTIDIKRDEECMKAFSEKYGLKFVTYTADELNGAGDCDAEGNPFHGSVFVRRTTGTDSVCERSAFLSSDKGRIIIRKNSSSGMTVSVALRDWKCRF